MKRLLTTTGLAAIFAAGLAAQATTGTSGTTAQDPQTPPAGAQRGGPRTLTGCLRAGDTAGTFLLTNVEGLGGRGNAAAGATTTGSTTTTATTGSTTQAAGRGMTLMLAPDSSVDLKPHVGHKIEVTGTMAGGGRRGGDTTTAGATTTGGGTTTGSTTTGSTTTGTGTATSGGQGAGMRSMAVTAVKMVSDSCS